MKVVAGDGQARLRAEYRNKKHDLFICFPLRVRIQLAEVSIASSLFVRDCCSSSVCACRISKKKKVFRYVQCVSAKYRKIGTTPTHAHGMKNATDQ